MATYINELFEPVWQSLRPVPIVTLDFGDGTIVTRTLHGNIATYLCRPTGEILDILPGIYEPGAFVRRMDQIRLLHNSTFEKMNADETVIHYHRTALKALKTGRKPPAISYAIDHTARRLSNFSKKAIELRLSLSPYGRIALAEESWLDSIKRKWKEKGGSKTATLDKGERLALKHPSDLSEWSLLLEDTRLNESMRRRQIHEALRHRLMRPSEVTKWLYREVLHADLDDPYLGLGEALFSNYPFAEEDARAH